MAVAWCAVLCFGLLAKAGCEWCCVGAGTCIMCLPRVLHVFWRAVPRSQCVGATLAGSSASMRARLLHACQSLPHYQLAECALLHACHPRLVGRLSIPASLSAHLVCLPAPADHMPSRRGPHRWQLPGTAAAAAPCRMQGTTGAPPARGNRAGSLSRSSVCACSDASGSPPAPSISLSFAHACGVHA